MVSYSLIIYMLDYNKESGDDDLIIVFKDNNDNDDIIKVFLSSD